MVIAKLLSIIARIPAWSIAKINGIERVAGLTRDTLAGEPGFELSWFVLPEFHNQGFATEVTAELEIRLDNRN